MREILLTSSVLIMTLLLLRRAFRQKIARRVQYALWGLVLVRLLIPVSLPALNFSVLTVAEPVRESISVRLEAPAFTAPVVPISNSQNQHSTSPYPEAVEPAIPGVASQPPSSPVAQEKLPAAVRELTLTEALGLVWLAGAAAMTVWLLASNLSFAVKLRKNRTRIEIPGCKYRVYMVESGLASPCLFGVLRPAIYLTPAAVRSEESLRHVLAHEETHAKHLDPLWSLLRSVCLTVYWFNPLVWLAASASKTDCELACDEGAIRRLGEGERLAYGKTLLSLIPVRRLPGNPLLSATTMSSDKKRLRDRITRIAENRRPRKLALCVLALLTAGTCVFTFAGCSETAEQPVMEKQDGPLMAAELRYFNEQFLNSGDGNINNKFLSSMYDTPEDIDIFELVYCGIPGEYYRESGKPEADPETVLNQVYDGHKPDCPDYEINTATLDALLTDKTGLTLAETNKAGMENFTYLPECDTYYWAHGDTNYRRRVDMIAGTREGDLLYLYYDDVFYADGWKCVTLRETETGYQFVSNKYSEKPVVVTAYPAEDPILTILLADLEGAEPEAVEMRHHSNDCEERLTGPGQNWMIGGHHIQGYRAANGIVYAAEITEAAVSSGVMTTWEADCFAVVNENFEIEPVDDLFGRSGFFLHLNDPESNTVYLDYNFFDEDGTLFNLCSVQSEGNAIAAQIIDLDGDGENELLCTNYTGDARLFFQRDGKICEANITELLREAWPEMGYTEFSNPAPYERCLSLWSFIPAAWDGGAEFQAEAFRNIYFDGENLLVYKPNKTAVDHVSPGITGPEDVMTTLRQVVQEHMEERVRDGGLEEAGIDDWRIIGLTGPWYEYYDGLTVEIYRYNYELHANAPEKVTWAGGLYVDEDGWVSPGYPDCDYLYFRKEEDGSRTYLYHDMDNSDGPGCNAWHGNLEASLLRRGLLEPGAGEQVQAALDRIMDNETVLLELELPTGSEKSFTVSPDLGNGRNRQSGFGSDYYFSWSAAGKEPPAGDPAPDATMLTVSTPDESLSLHFFSDSEMVLCKDGDTTQWYRAENMTDPSDAFYEYSDVFNYMRQWYDEAELDAARSEIVIPDDGRSREEIAEEWVNRYEGAHLWLTSGSRFKWSYIDIQDVDLHYWDEADLSELLTEYKESSNAQDVFLFNYNAVFVPEGDIHWFMAGNTGEYEGDDAPEGALTWWMCGYMYLTEDGWRCNGVGTGP